MAGYVFAIGGDKDPVDLIRECAEEGIYSTYLSGISSLPFEGTLTDRMSMKPGDNIYISYTDATPQNEICDRSCDKL